MSMQKTGIGGFVIFPMMLIFLFVAVTSCTNVQMPGREQQDAATADENQSLEAMQGVKEQQEEQQIQLANQTSGEQPKQEHVEKNESISQIAQIGCPVPLTGLAHCKSPCDKQGGNCTFIQESQQGDRCYTCVVPTCPTNTTADQKLCQKQCPGICNETATAGNKSCYQCFIPHCGNGTVSDQQVCQQQCSFGACVVAGELKGFQCWKCKPDCSKYCPSKGYAASQLNFTEMIESQLNQKFCVKSVRIILGNDWRTADCYCYSAKNPTITFDETKPVCPDTPCGDVTCGESKTCSDEEGMVMEVTCNWEGWKKVATYEYVPTISASLG